MAGVLFTQDRRIVRFCLVRGSETPKEAGVGVINTTTDERMLTPGEG